MEKLRFPSPQRQQGLSQIPCLRCGLWTEKIEMAWRMAGVLLLLLLLPGWSRVSADKAPSKLSADAGGTWWSLKPISKPALPRATGKFKDWARNPIDRFILAKLLEKRM